jgi:hypothetical protein
MKYLNTFAIRALLALAAGATLATAAQAETFYYTFKGQISDVNSRSYGTGSTPNPVTTGDGSSGHILTTTGSVFSFTLGLDNGGSSALGQTWTADNVRTMRFELPTDQGKTFFYNMQFGGATGIATKYLNERQGVFTTDAKGLVSSVFSALAFTVSRSVKPFVPTPDQIQTNGDAPILQRDFGMFNTEVFSSVPALRIAATYAGNPTVPEVESRGNTTSIGWGAGTGLDTASKWNVSTATGAPIAAAVPEPEAWALMVGGLLVVGAAGRKTRAKA